MAIRPTLPARGRAPARHLPHREIAFSFTQQELIDYLSTQTNVIATVEEGGLSLTDVKRRLRRELEPIFTQRTLTVCFGGPIWILEAAS